MENIILKNIHFDKNVVCYNFEVSPGLKKYFNNDKLWIEYDESLND